MIPGFDRGERGATKRIFIPKGEEIRGWWKVMKPVFGLAEWLLVNSDKKTPIEAGGGEKVN